MFALKSKLTGSRPMFLVFLAILIALITWVAVLLFINRGGEEAATSSSEEQALQDRYPDRGVIFEYKPPPR